MDYTLTDIESMWAKRSCLRIDGVFYGSGKVILFRRVRKDADIICAEDLVTSITDLATLLKEGKATLTSLIEVERFEMEDENLCLISGKGASEKEGFVVAEELPSRRLLWMAYFTFSEAFTNVKFGDNSLIADSARYQEWKFPLEKPEALSIRPSENQPAPPMSQSHLYFKRQYPWLYNFMETSLWPDVDSFNPIESMHRYAYYDHSDSTRNMIEELKTLYSDDNISNEDISKIFNKEDIGHPYEVVNKDNAKDFCYSIYESLKFVNTLKT